MWLLLGVRLVADVVTVNLSFLIAYFIKFQTFNLNFAHVNVYYKLLIFVTMIWLIVFNLGGLYKLPKKETPRTDTLVLTSLTITSAAFITVLVIFLLYQEATYALDIVFYAWFAALFLVNLARSLIWFYLIRS